MGLKRFICVLVLLLAATSAQAQTNPLGAGYSLSHGQLFVQISPSLNSLKLPFTISMNAVVPTVTGGVKDTLITSNPSGSGTGGFYLGYANQSQTAYQLQALIEPASTAGGNLCTHGGEACWRFNFLQDGNRHHLCVRWTPSQVFLYLDGIIRQQAATYFPSIFPVANPYVNTSDLFWSLGANAPTTWNLYDARVYSGDIGSAGCSQLAVYAAQGVYPTTGPLASGMVLHLPMDSTAAPCTLSGGQWSCADTSGNGNNANNGAATPTVAITTPAAGPVSGTTSITATCTIPGGSCSQVCYYMDGYLLGACSTTSPNYTFSWDTTKAIDGAHTLTAVGYSVSGLATTSAAVSVTTSNGVVGITYQFDGVNGLDSNNCTAGASLQDINEIEQPDLQGRRYDPVQ